MSAAGVPVVSVLDDLLAQADVVDGEAPIVYLTIVGQAALPMAWSRRAMRSA